VPTATYEFIGSCPSLPAWFVNWVSEDETSSETSFSELEVALEGNSDFDAYMRYRLEQIEIHPDDDWSISFLTGKTPTGLPFMVIQDAGIEHVYVAGAFDIAKEEAEARRMGFWWLAENPELDQLKASLMPSR